MNSRSFFLPRLLPAGRRQRMPYQIREAGIVSAAEVFRGSADRQSTGCFPFPTFPADGCGDNGKQSKTLLSTSANRGLKPYRPAKPQSKSGLPHPLILKNILPPPLFDRFFVLLAHRRAENLRRFLPLPRYFRRAL